MSYALWLPERLAARGLRVEVVPGWETRSAGSFNPKGSVSHWTAGPRGATGRPSLNVVVNGRPDLDGPLCNVYGARDGTAVVVAAGRANHAGAGGWRGLVGNSSVLGTEMEAADNADFTDAQRWAYPRINAAYCEGAGFGPEMVCGHSEWAPDRKIDINGYTMDDMRREVAALLSGEDDFMSALTDAEQRRLLGNTDRLAATALPAVGRIELGIYALRHPQPGTDQQDPAALADAIVTALPKDLAQQVVDALVARLKSS